MNDIRQFAPFDPSRIKRVAREKVLFKRAPNPEKVGAIFIPETSRFQDRADIAVIVGVGAGIDEVKAGDKILLPDHLMVTGKFTHEGETYTVLNKEQLEQVAIVEEE